MKPAVGSFKSKVKVCVEGLEYTAECDGSLMHTLTYSEVSCAIYE